MKKYLALFIVVGFLVVLPAHAQTTAQTQTTLQNTLNALRAQLASLQAAAITATTMSVTGAKAVSVQPAVNTVSTAGCGQTMTPRGTVNQTIRCNGTNWVAAGNLLNDGTNVSMGSLWSAPPNFMKFGVVADAGNTNAIYGSSGVSGIGVEGHSQHGMGVYGHGDDGKGIVGESINGIGVLGTAGNNGVGGVAIALKAVNNSPSGLGIVQEGDNVKNDFAGSYNHFKGKLGIGTDSPWATLSVKSGDPSMPAIEARGGVKISSTNFERPTCTNELRGTFWFVQGATKDTLQICAKDTSEPTLGWRTLW